MGRESVQQLAGEADLPGFVVQCAAQAVDQRAFAGAVRANEPQPLSLRDSQVHVGQGDETAKALAEARDLQQRAHRLNQPRMPFGAAITKATRSRPTISRDRAEEIVTVATCCKVPRRTAPIMGPNQLSVPPIRGMAMVLTA